ncbi:FeoC-like transcriptional regulator [Synechococcus sp. PCC 7335]|uniref:FeoC-like transcriptional regulator n=1 Tax=Synechococcus sp. (strain ATCC 29403 / PCC 7335) TaxID=91464 RepID=UPI0008FEC87B
MLIDVQNYIATHGTVSVIDLSYRFHTDASTLKPMLSKLSRKGRIQAVPIATKCKGCTVCDSLQLECYRWLEASK